MKRREFLLPCGVSYTINDHGINDLVDGQWLKENLTKEYMASQIDPHTTGRKYLPIAQRIGTKILRAIFKRIVDLAMESNRVRINKAHYIYIGQVDKNNRYDSIATDGKIYGLKITGNHTYKMRMPNRRRMELKKRINNGQKFLR